MIASVAVANADTIVNSPAFLRAWHYRPGTPDWTVIVWASVLVRFTDRLYLPVVETLAGLDITAVRVETVYDPRAMNQRAVIRAYTIAGRKTADRGEPPDRRSKGRVA